MGVDGEKILLQYLKDRGGYASLSEFRQKSALQLLVEKGLVRVVRQYRNRDQPNAWFVELVYP
ncbi:hypothetical protein RINTHM_15280 [Richelia intracellularis HM01]|jgi:hypothetical protein|uniref:Uncharacterized protein n=1 Tax=Richelia intracellularis HH01 TaxID=1165094 RepID=M1WZI6_9NOST|nr:hypothetical protein [Richelia intracellularis]CCH65985.1 hypothetical protein RINTHM_15280 [Richelia intracellularis HM01]CCH66838.1 hypothetical protein RINTHH_6830 [Richelia intracellularis HH01]